MAVGFSNNALKAVPFRRFSPFTADGDAELGTVSITKPVMGEKFNADVPFPSLIGCSEILP